jgi:5-methylcytosine-specific restriction endonuclease McrA
VKKRTHALLLVNTEYERSCTDCGRLLPPSSFYATPKWWCKECVKRRAKAAIERRGLEARRAIQKASYERNREKACAAGQEYRNRPDVKEDRRQKAVAYRQQTKEHKREYLRQWYQQHPERARDTYKRGAGTRRARMAEIVTERFTYQEIFERDGGRCRYCGVALDPKNWHLDHIIPVSRGGPHTRINACASCPTCNLKKSNKLLLEAIVMQQAQPSEAEDWTRQRAAPQNAMAAP